MTDSAVAANIKLKAYKAASNGSSLPLAYSGVKPGQKCDIHLGPICTGLVKCIKYWLMLLILPLIFIKVIVHAHEHWRYSS